MMKRAAAMAKGLIASEGFEPAAIPTKHEATLKACRLEVGRFLDSSHVKRRVQAK